MLTENFYTNGWPVECRNQKSRPENLRCASSPRKFEPCQVLPGAGTGPAIAKWLCLGDSNTASSIQVDLGVFTTRLTVYFVLLLCALAFKKTAYMAKSLIKVLE